MKAQDDAVKNALKAVKQQFAPDRRVAVYDVQAERTPAGVVLKGDVESAEARTASVEAVKKTGEKSVVDSIRILPDPALGTNEYGILIISTGNLRGQPGESEELTSQALMGSVVKLLRTPVHGYYYVQMADKYLGWLDRSSVAAVTRAQADAWTAAKKVVVTDYLGIVRATPDAEGEVVCDITAGGVLKSNGTQGSWTAVELADGRKGFLPTAIAPDLDTWKSTRKLTGENLEKTAKRFIGFPYLWGGTSGKGLDCSGFVKTVYRLNGTELNRDANQQATMGTEPNPGKDFEGLKKGDLLFFGQKATADKPERITHVGMYLENRTFIHSSGRVRISSFDPASPLFEESLLKRFVRARRIIPDTAPKP